MRLFKRTDFYCLHGQDALLAADFALKIIKYMGDDPVLSYDCLDKHEMKSFVRELLLVPQYRVEKKQWKG